MADQSAAPQRGVQRQRSLATLGHTIRAPGPQRPRLREASGSATPTHNHWALVLALEYSFCEPEGPYPRFEGTQGMKLPILVRPLSGGLTLHDASESLGMIHSIDPPLAGSWPRTPQPRIRKIAWCLSQRGQPGCSRAVQDGRRCRASSRATKPRWGADATCTRPGERPRHRQTL